jgi:predicted nucleic acid-binding protein
MVLVDTSVWIRSLSNREPHYKAELARLLELDEVAGHELVYGELLIGDRGGRHKFLGAYERIHQAKLIPHREMVQFVRQRDLYGRGVGWIDIHLLASALVGRMQLWTADLHCCEMAMEFGIAYRAPADAKTRPVPSSS